MAEVISPKGVVELKLGSATFYLTPTFGAQELIERDTGFGLFELGTRFEAWKVSINEIFAIYRHGIDAGSNPVVSDDALKDMIAKAGISVCIPPVIAFLGAALNGWGDEEKKPLAVSNE